MKPFTACTRRGRLRGLARAALRHYDLDIERLDLLTTYTNIMYRVTTCGGERFALRLANPRWLDWEAAGSEVLWLDALAADTTIPVPRILRTVRGEGIVRPAAPGAPVDWHALLMSWQPGVLLGKRITPATWPAWARFLRGCTGTAPPGSHRRNSPPAHLPNTFPVVNDS